MYITVDCSTQIGEFKHFWKSTGFTPASLLLNADMRQTMIYAGSLPNRGITYVRVHYLLELVSGTGFGTDAVQYDWSVLDTALDVLIDNGLLPIFELMGNPSGFFTDFLDDRQAQAWRQFVRDLVLHYIDRYGMDNIRKWFFETWNEPDIGWWKQSNEAFMVYYDACSEGLNDVNPELKLGGPGTAKTLSPLFREFLLHCDSGMNYFTGETGIRLDFISVHEKGVRNSPEDLNPNSIAITQREIETIAYIRTHHPRLSHVPFMNNECDPQVGWKDFHTWRGRPYYASMMCKIIYQHLTHLVDDLGVNYSLLGNDHGFVGEWGNRTLVARFGDINDNIAQAQFQMQETDRQEDDRRRKFEAIKKPALNVMALLSLLGDQRCAVQGLGNGSDMIGAIATTYVDNQVAILVYHSRDEIISSRAETVALIAENMPFDEAVLAHYRIDESHGNPFAIWEEQGAHQLPSQEELAELRLHHEPTLLESPSQVRLEDGNFQLEFEMPLHSVSLIVLSNQPEQSPEPPTNLRLELFEGLHGVGQIMVIWDEPPSARFIQTYEVLFRETSDDPFERINDVDLICTAYLHVPHQQIVRGEYQIRAIDYWGRHSESAIVPLVID